MCEKFGCKRLSGRNLRSCTLDLEPVEWIQEITKGNELDWPIKFTSGWVSNVWVPIAEAGNLVAAEPKNKGIMLLLRED